MRSEADNVASWLVEHARRHGERPALRDAERRLSYAALEERCARAAGALRALGLAPGERVALLLGNRSALLEVVFAAARLGAIAVPLNTRLAAPEIAEQLSDCRPAMLLHEAALQPLADAACALARHAPAARLAAGGAPDLWEAALAGATPLREVTAVSPEDPMILMYTSGTKQGFGQTETSILCCLDAADAVRKGGSVGRPVPHAELRIVRREDLALPVARWRDCAAGESGEIVVRGPITMTGYWERPEASAETLREGWLLTGDLGHFDAEGFVTLDGRSKDLFISGGENVYPRQVEAVYEQHPAVREVAVVGVPDPRWGEVGCAYVVLKPGAVLEVGELVRFGRERLAGFKVPQHFVATSELPRTASGKVQKHRL